MNEHRDQAPVLPISSRELAAAREQGGVVLLRHQNDVVGVARLVYPPIPFPRGSTDAEIAEAWREAQNG